jgi:hypothetical protein
VLRENRVPAFLTGRGGIRDDDLIACFIAAFGAAAVYAAAGDRRRPASTKGRNGVVILRHMTWKMFWMSINF